MSTNIFLPDELVTVREKALELFWADDSNRDEWMRPYRAEIPDEVLMKFGYWDEASAEVFNINHE